MQNGGGRRDMMLKKSNLHMPTTTYNHSKHVMDLPHSLPAIK